MTTERLTACSLLPISDSELCWDCQRNPRPVVRMKDGKEVRATKCYDCAKSRDLKAAIRRSV